MKLTSIQIEARRHILTNNNCARNYGGAPDAVDAAQLICIMPKMRSPGHHPSRNPRRDDGFTRVDLITTVLILSMLGLLVIPGFARASLTATGSSCVDNQRRLSLAWQQYAADHSDRLVNNFTIPDTLATISNGQNDTWALNVLDWTTNQRNTNQTYIRNSKLFPYLQSDTLAFKCPADNFLSSAQRAAGWTRRARSYSMNALMGKNSPNDQAVNNGQSSWVTGKRQFLKTASIVNPANTIVFLDEHPDSVNDGFFIQFPSQQQWTDLPASQHNGGCGFDFADG